MTDQPADTPDTPALPESKLFPCVDADDYYMGGVILHLDQLERDRYVFVDGARDVDFPRDLQPRECARLVDSAWVYLPCWRDVPLYDKATGNPVMAARGETPESLNATTKPWPGPGFAWVHDDWAETPEAIKARLTNDVQRYLDDTARSSGYDDIKSAVTYADEPAVTKFQIEGQAFRAWRSHIWEACYQLLAEVEAGTRPVPTKAELLAELAQLAPLTLPSST